MITLVYICIMENIFDDIRDRQKRAVAIRYRRTAEGAVDISDSALRVALAHIRLEKEIAIDQGDDQEAQDWRHEENNVVSALGGFGLAQPGTY